jgi:transglycosylase-like protein with SLT domain
VTTLSGISFGAQIETAARAHGIDPRFLAAIAAQETGGPGSNSGANVVGDGGHGRGLFQIDDRWHAFARSAAAMDPAKNADYAAGMLSGLLTRYGGDAKAALSAYNAGSPTAPGTATTWGDGATLGYADSVLRHYAALGGDASTLGQQLVDGRADVAPAANALAGIAGAIVPGGVLGGASAPATAPAFQVSLPQPAPYPTQYRSYTSLSGLDSNQPQALDAEMTGLIDGANGLAVMQDGSGG